MSVNSIGNSILNSMGANRFDVSKMSTTLAEADVASVRSNLERTETSFSNRLTGFDTLEFAFNAFKEQMSGLADIAGSQKRTANSSDPNVISATINGQASSGTYQVQVQSLASSHTLATQAEFPSTSSIVGEGSLSFNVGGAVSTITIDATNNSLTGIQNTVNNANIGINATIINVGTGHKLMFSALNSGAAHTISVSVTNDADANNTDALGLSRLASNNMMETVVASDARLIINGLSVTSSSNNIEGVIAGVTLNLRSSDAGNIKTIDIARDTTNLQTGVKDFVELFNALNSIISDLGAHTVPKDAKEDAVTGFLSGDSTLRTVNSAIREVMMATVPGLTGSVQFLADIGITTQLDGTLGLDETKLNAALATNPEAVGKLFAANAVASDNLVSFKGSTANTVEGSFNLQVSVIASKASITGAAVAGTGITIDNTNNTFKIRVDGAESLNLVLNSGAYTKTALAQEIARVINNDTNISAAGRVSVEYNPANSSFMLVSEKYGSSSKLELISGNFLTSAVAGLGVSAETTGQDVQGFLQNSVGDSFGFVGSGQNVIINSILSGAPRGLEFAVAGGITGDRGTIEFNRGYADKLGHIFTQFLDKDNGLIGSRVSNISDRLAEIDKQKDKVDLRFEALEMKYRLQFGALQAMLSHMDATRESLAASLAIRTER